MAFHPDIIVMAADRTDVELVAEIKHNSAAVEDAEAQLKQYMSGMHCELGMLVSTDEARVYRDTFAPGDDSIKEIFRLRTADLLGHRLDGLSGRDLDLEFKAWLQQITAGEFDALPSTAEGRRALAFLAPVLAGSRVIAGGYQ